MAKSEGTYQGKRVRRKGVHAKRGTSGQKNSKVYQKKYRGQGR